MASISESMRRLIPNPNPNPNWRPGEHLGVNEEIDEAGKILIRCDGDEDGRIGKSEFQKYYEQTAAAITKYRSAMAAKKKAEETRAAAEAEALELEAAANAAEAAAAEEESRAVENAIAAQKNEPRTVPPLVTPSESNLLKEPNPNPNPNPQSESNLLKEAFKEMDLNPNPNPNPNPNLKEAFKEMDLNGNGRISHKESMRLTLTLT